MLAHFFFREFFQLVYFLFFYLKVTLVYFCNSFEALNNMFMVRVVD